MQPEDNEGVKDVAKVQKFVIKRAKRKSKLFTGEVETSKGDQLDFWDQGGV